MSAEPKPQEQQQKKSVHPFPPLPNSNNEKPVALFILFQHGSHGAADSLSVLKERVLKEHILRNGNIKGIQLWDTNVNSRLASDEGTVLCGDRLLKALVPVLKAFVEKYEEKKFKLVFSVVGLSFGGILTRELVFRLVNDFPALASALEFDSFISIASPHVGAIGMGVVKRLGGKLIGKVYSKTYSELLLDDKLLLDYMCNDAHVAAWKLFRHRVLLGNLSHDNLVSFGSASIIPDDDESAKHVKESNFFTDTISWLASEVEVDFEQGANILESEVTNPTSSPILKTTTATSAASSSSSSTKQKDDEKEKDKDDDSELAIAKKIARKLRKALTFTVINVKPNQFFATAHHSIVAKSWISAPIEDALDVVGFALTQAFGGGGGKSVSSSVSSSTSATAASS